MTKVHTCILWRILSLGKQLIKSSKRVVSVASSDVSVKTESLLLFPTDVGSLCWFRRWSPAGFLPSLPPPHRESVDLEIYFQSLGQWAVIAIWNGAMWPQTQHHSFWSVLTADPLICLRIHILLSEWGLKNLWSSTKAMFANLLIQILHSRP